MRQLSIAFSLLLVASVVSADEAKKTEAKTPAAAPAVTSTVPDSPLVAAAKKSKRKNAKPANVITNETLAKSGGHVTQAAKLPDLLPVPPPPKPEAVDPLAADRARRAELVKKQEEEKKVAEQKKADAQRARATSDDDSLDDRFDDPAAAEHAMQQDPATSTQKPPM
jgi:hypothetical protein